MFKMNIKASQYDKNVHVSLYHTLSKFGKNKTNSKLDHPSKCGEYRINHNKVTAIKRCLLQKFKPV